MGDGNNATPRARDGQQQHPPQGRGDFRRMQPGEGMKKALGMSPVEVIREVKTARLRGAAARVSRRA